MEWITRVENGAWRVECLHCVFCVSRRVFNDDLIHANYVCFFVVVLPHCFFGYPPLARMASAARTAAKKLTGLQRMKWNRTAQRPALDVSVKMETLSRCEHRLPAAEQLRLKDVPCQATGLRVPSMQDSDKPVIITPSKVTVSFPIMGKKSLGIAQQSDLVHSLGRRIHCLQESVLEKAGHHVV